MALAATRTWFLYSSAIGYIKDGTISLTDGVFRMAALSSGYDPSVASDSVRADLATHVLGTGDQSVTLSLATVGGYTTISLAADAQWPGAISPRHFAIYDDSTTSPVDALLCVADMGGTQTVPSGMTLKVKDV